MCLCRGRIDRADIAALTLALLGGLVPAVPLRAQVSVVWQQPTAGVALALDAGDSVYTLSYVYELGAEMWLTRRDPDGALLWQARHDQTDPTKWERASWVATDGGGNAIVAGTLMSGYSNPVEAASIVMKFDPAGTLLWRHVYESWFDGSSTRRCLVDADDNIYVLGRGTGPAGQVTKVKKFAPDGTALWSWFDAAGIGGPVNVKFTPEGHLLIVGRAITGSINGYARIDRDGNTLWSYPGVDSLTVGDASGDRLGNTFLVHGEYVMNGGTVIKKVDPTGALLWERTYPLSAFRIEVTSDGGAVVSGFPDSGTAGAAFLRVDPGGGQLWSNLDADGPLQLLLHAQMLVDGSDAAYLAAGTLFDMAVCKVNGDGSSAWTQTVSGSYANAIALGSTSSVFVVGGETARLDQTSGLGPGSVGNDLKLAKTAGSVVMAWGPSCGPDATDYAIYQGAIGTWADAAPVTCSTAGSTSFALTPVSGSAFFLVAPLSATAQGPAGFDPTPPAVLCAATFDATGCR